MKMQSLPKLKLKLAKCSAKVLLLSNDSTKLLFSCRMQPMENPKELSLNDKDAIRILLWANSLTRFGWFLRIYSKCKGENYWRALSYAYTCSDNLCMYRDESKKLFQSQQPGRDALMMESELEYLNSLPEKVTIYRGMTVEEYESGNWSVSWTLNESVAKFFCDTYSRNYKDNGKPKMVHSITINKDKVIAYLNGRKEEEIIYIH